MATVVMWGHRVHLIHHQQVAGLRVTRSRSGGFQRQSDADHRRHRHAAERTSRRAIALVENGRKDLPSSFSRAPGDGRGARGNQSCVGCVRPASCRSRSRSALCMAKVSSKIASSSRAVDAS